MLWPGAPAAPTSAETGLSQRNAHPGARTAFPRPLQVFPHTSHPQWVLGTPEACRMPPTAELCLAGTSLLGPSVPVGEHPSCSSSPSITARTCAGASSPQGMGCLSHTCLPHTPARGRVFLPPPKTGGYKIAGCNCFSPLAFMRPGRSTAGGAEQDTRCKLIKVLEELEESYH